MLVPTTQENGIWLDEVNLGTVNVLIPICYSQFLQVEVNGSLAWRTGGQRVWAMNARQEMEGHFTGCSGKGSASSRVTGGKMFLNHVNMQISPWNYSHTCKFHATGTGKDPQAGLCSVWFKDGLWMLISFPGLALVIVAFLQGCLLACLCQHCPLPSLSLSPFSPLVFCILISPSFFTSCRTIWCSELQPTKPCAMYINLLWLVQKVQINPGFYFPKGAKDNWRR